VFNTTQNLAAISVSGSGANASMATNGSRVLVVDSAAVTSGGKLDLYDNDLILKQQRQLDRFRRDEHDGVGTSRIVQLGACAQQPILERRPEHEDDI
jgi:hypothetical protein